jgi:hypothetical protein
MTLDFVCSSAGALKKTPDDGSPAGAGPLSDGRYWARTSDLRLVEAALSQLS